MRGCTIRPSEFGWYFNVSRLWIGKSLPIQWVSCISRKSLPLGLIPSPSSYSEVIAHILFLLLLPSLCGPFFPFIFFAEKPLISAVEAASVLFENLFLPPKPNFSSFFCFLFLGASRPGPCFADLDGRSSFTASSRATSKRSSSCVAPVSVFFRSVDM